MGGIELFGVSALFGPQSVTIRIVTWLCRGRSRDLQGLFSFAKIRKWRFCWLLERGLAGNESRPETCGLTRWFRMAIAVAILLAGAQRLRNWCYKELDREIGMANSIGSLAKSKKAQNPTGSVLQWDHFDELPDAIRAYVLPGCWHLYPSQLNQREAWHHLAPMHPMHPMPMPMLALLSCWLFWTVQPPGPILSPHPFTFQIYVAWSTL